MKSSLNVLPKDIFTKMIEEADIADRVEMAMTIPEFDRFYKDMRNRPSYWIKLINEEHGLKIPLNTEISAIEGERVFQILNCAGSRYDTVQYLPDLLLPIKLILIDKGWQNKYSEDVNEESESDDIPRLITYGTEIYESLTEITTNYFYTCVRNSKITLVLLLLEVVSKVEDLKLQKNLQDLVFKEFRRTIYEYTFSKKKSQKLRDILEFLKNNSLPMPENVKVKGNLHDNFNLLEKFGILEEYGMIIVISEVSISQIIKKDWNLYLNFVSPRAEFFEVIMKINRSNKFKQIVERNLNKVDTVNDFCLLVVTNAEIENVEFKISNKIFEELDEILSKITSKEARKIYKLLMEIHDKELLTQILEKVPNLLTYSVLTDINNIANTSLRHPSIFYSEMIRKLLNSPRLDSLIQLLIQRSVLDNSDTLDTILIGFGPKLKKSTREQLKQLKESL